MVELQSVEIQLKHLGSPNYVIVLAVKIWDLYLHCFLKVLAPYLWKVPHSIVAITLRITLFLPSHGLLSVSPVWLTHAGRSRLRPMPLQFIRIEVV